jgi:hypothetical protein
MGAAAPAAPVEVAADEGSALLAMVRFENEQKRAQRRHDGVRRGDLEITAIEKREATGRRHWREVRSVSVCVYTTI